MELNTLQTAIWHLDKKAECEKMLSQLKSQQHRDLKDFFDWVVKSQPELSQHLVSLTTPVQYLATYIKEEMEKRIKDHSEKIKAL